MKTTRNRIWVLGLIFSIITFSYSFYFLFFNGKGKSHGNFIRVIQESKPEVIGFLDLLPKERYYFAGKDSNSLWLGNENTPFQLIKISFGSTFDTSVILLPHYKKALPGTLAYICYPYFTVINGPQKQVLRGNVNDSSEIATFVVDRNFDIGCLVGPDAIVLRLLTPDGFQLARYKHGGTLKELNALSTKGVSILSRDGVMMYDGQTQLFAYTYFYRNSIVFYDNSFSRKWEMNTIDSITFPLISLGAADKSGTRRMNVPPSTVNFRADMSNGKIVIYSKATSSKPPIVNRDMATFDVYSINEKRYISSFLIPDKYNGQKIQDFRVYYPYLFLLCKDKVVLMKI